MILSYLTTSITIFCNLYTYIVIIYILILIFSPGSINKFTFISVIVTPPLQQIRKVLPPIGFIDLSPIILIICIDLIKYILIAFLTMFK